jgi:tetrahydrodipicolinate N-succinyltransferase
VSLSLTYSDITPFEAAFKSSRSDEVDHTREKLAAIDEEHARSMRKSVALLALQNRQAKMLEMCFEQKFPFEAYFIDEADRVEESKDPETFRVLEQSTLREQFPRLTGPLIEHGPGAFDRGGKYPVDW